MLDWFSSLEWFSKIYWVITIIASLNFIVTIVMPLIGGDTDELSKVDAEIDGDTGIGFEFITYKNLVGFFTIFGWSGIACIDEGFSKPITIIISLICGLIMMAVLAAMFYYIKTVSNQMDK